MSEEAWEHLPQTFRAYLRRRGRKAADDRRCLEALHFLTVAKVRWRALPKGYANWNTVWKRFKRVVLNCGKTADDFHSIISLAGGPSWIKFSRTVREERRF